MPEPIDAKAVAKWINEHRHKVGLTGAGGLYVIRAVFVERDDCIVLVTSHDDNDATERERE